MGGRGSHDRLLLLSASEAPLPLMSAEAPAVCRCGKLSLRSVQSALPASTIDTCALHQTINASTGPKHCKQAAQQPMLAQSLTSSFSTTPDTISSSPKCRTSMPRASFCRQSGAAQRWLEGMQCRDRPCLAAPAAGAACRERTYRSAAKPHHTCGRAAKTGQASSTTCLRKVDARLLEQLN